MYKYDNKEKTYELLHIEQWILKEGEASGDKGILVRPTDDVKSLFITLKQAPIVAFDFKNFSDGISYSQVKLLRKELGYEGEIRALNTHIDHLQFIFRSGVDSYELLPEYKEYSDEYAIDFDISYQTARNNSGAIEHYKQNNLYRS